MTNWYQSSYEPRESMEDISFDIMKGMARLIQTMEDNSPLQITSLLHYLERFESWRNTLLRVGSNLELKSFVDKFVEGLKSNSDYRSRAFTWSRYFLREHDCETWEDYIAAFYERFDYYLRKEKIDNGLEDNLSPQVFDGMLVEDKLIEVVDGKETWKEEPCSDFAVVTLVPTSVQNENDVIENLKCQVFDEVTERGSMPWTTLIDGYVKIGDIWAGKRLFEWMFEKNIFACTEMVDAEVRLGLLNHENNSDIMLMEARALTHLVEVRHSSYATNSDVIPLVGLLLFGRNYLLQETFSIALVKLGKDRPTCKMKMVKAGVIKSILEILRDAPDFLCAVVTELLKTLANNYILDGQHITLQVLVNILEQPQCPAYYTLMAHQAIEPRIPLLDSPASLVQQPATELLSRVLLKEHLQKYPVAQQVSSPLVRVLGSGISILQQRTVKAFVSVVFTWPNEIAKEGVVAELSRVILQADPLPSQALWESSAAVLSSISQYSSESSKLMPWRSNSGPVENFVVQPQFVTNGSSHLDHIVIASSLLSISQNSIESDLKFTYVITCQKHSNKELRVGHQSSSTRYHRRRDKNTSMGIGELFRFVDGLEYVLMGMRTVGVFVHGCSLPLFLRFFTDLVDSFGANANTVDQMTTFLLAETQEDDYLQEELQDSRRSYAAIVEKECHVSLEKDQLHSMLLKASGTVGVEGELSLFSAFCHEGVSASQFADCNAEMQFVQVASMSKITKVIEPEICKPTNKTSSMVGISSSPFQQNRVEEARLVPKQMYVGHHVVFSKAEINGATSSKAGRELIDKLLAKILIDQVLEAQGVQEWFESATEIGSPYALLLALKMLDNIGVDHRAFSKLLPSDYSPSELFTSDHLSSLANCLKESTFYQPRVHSVWPNLISVLLPVVVSSKQGRVHNQSAQEASYGYDILRLVKRKDKPRMQWLIPWFVMFEEVITEKVSDFTEHQFLILKS